MLPCLYCTALKGWSLLPNALRHFQDLLWPLNLGITRTWIYRLNFAQGPIFFQIWSSLTSLKSQTWNPSLKSLPEDCAQDFYVLKKKIHWPQPGFNPRTLDLEAGTYHRGRLPCLWMGIWFFKMEIFSISRNMDHKQPIVWRGEKSQMGSDMVWREVSMRDCPLAGGQTAEQTEVSHKSWGTYKYLVPWLMLRSSSLYFYLFVSNSNQNGNK